MGDKKKVKEKCCQKYEKKGKHCKSCPALQDSIAPSDAAKKERKDKKKKS